MIRFSVNGERIETDLPADTPLLWFLRDNLQMTGTKFGCGMALCGACTVHVNGEPVRSCSTPLSVIKAKGQQSEQSEGSNKAKGHVLPFAHNFAIVASCPALFALNFPARCITSPRVEIVASPFLKTMRTGATF